MVSRHASSIARSASSVMSQWSAALYAVTPGTAAKAPCACTKADSCAGPPPAGFSVLNTVPTNVMRSPSIGGRHIIISRFSSPTLCAREIVFSPPPSPPSPFFLSRAPPKKNCCRSRRCCASSSSSSCLPPPLLPTRARSTSRNEVRCTGMPACVIQSTMSAAPSTSPSSSSGRAEGAAGTLTFLRAPPAPPSPASNASLSSSIVPTSAPVSASALACASRSSASRFRSYSPATRSASANSCMRG